MKTDSLLEHSSSEIQNDCKTANPYKITILSFISLPFPLSPPPLEYSLLSKIVFNIINPFMPRGVLDTFTSI